MKEYFLKASNALTQLNSSVSSQARSIADITVKIYTKFEEIRYASESIPDYILHPDRSKSNLKLSGEISSTSSIYSL
jgi:hypothetical protein